MGIRLVAGVALIAWLHLPRAANAGGGCAPGELCEDTDGNECTFAQCRFDGFCDQTLPKDIIVPCTDTDGIECTDAHCDGAGACNQTHPAFAGTPCTDTGGNECL